MKHSKWLSAMLGVGMALSMSLTACGGGDDGSPLNLKVPPGKQQPVGHALSGFVTDPADSGGSMMVPNLLVTVKKTADGSTLASTKTDGNGRYKFASLPAETEVRLTVAPETALKPGTLSRYAPNVRKIKLGEDGAQSQVDITVGSARAAPMNIATAQVMTPFGVSSGPAAAGQVALPAASLVRADGKPLGATQTSFINIIDPSKSTGAGSMAVFPGNMEATSSGGNAVSIASLGAMSIEFFDADGTPLNLAAGQKATLRIPVPASLRASARADWPTIPLWWFDTASGLWKEEGSAKLAADNSYYEGAVSHFTYWNADHVIERTQAKGKLVFKEGGVFKPLKNQLVTVDGVDYGYQKAAVTDINGEFSVFVRRNYQVSIRTFFVNGSVASFTKGPAPDAPTWNMGQMEVAAPPPPLVNGERTLSFNMAGHIGLYLGTGVAITPPNIPLIAGADINFDFFEKGLQMGVGTFGGPNDRNTPNTTKYGMQLLNIDYAALSTAPESGYKYCNKETVTPEGFRYCMDFHRFEVVPTPAGKVYAFKTRAGFYGKLVITQVKLPAAPGDPMTITVKYKINLDGQRAL